MGRGPAPARRRASAWTPRSAYCRRGQSPPHRGSPPPPCRLLHHLAVRLVRLVPPRLRARHLRPVRRPRGWAPFRRLRGWASFRRLRGWERSLGGPGDRPCDAPPAVRWRRRAPWSAAGQAAVAGWPRRTSAHRSGTRRASGAGRDRRRGYALGRPARPPARRAWASSCWPGLCLRQEQHRHRQQTSRPLLLRAAWTARRPPCASGAWRRGWWSSSA